MSVSLGLEVPARSDHEVTLHTVPCFLCQFLLSIEGTNWFQGTISSVDLDYEIVCPYSSLGCRHICLRTELDKHLAKDCRFNKEPEDSDFETLVGDFWVLGQYLYK